MSTNDATMPERPEAEVLATADAAVVAPAPAVKTAALPLPAEATDGAMLESSRRVIEEMSRELEANLGQLDARERLALAEPLARLRQTAAMTAPSAGDRALAESLPRPAALAPLAWAMVAIVGWLVLFTAGVAIPAAPYIVVLDQMNQSSASLLNVLGAGAMVVLCSTFANPGILACLAAFLGGVTKGAQSADSQSAGGRSAASTAAPYLSAVVRGFFLYLVLLSGLLLLTTKAITEGTQDQYVQLAGTVSVLAFMVGYDSDFFFRIVRRLDDWTQRASQHETGTDKQP